ncbi:MAG: deoxyribose-phosphate aldolase [Burkholderiales bacterium]
MTRAELARLIDHSVLKPESTARDIVAGALVAREWKVGYYCVQPCWVTLASASLAGSTTQVISVVGFPHGCDIPDAKARATERAIADGAREIDTVMHFGALLGDEPAKAAADVAAVVRAAQGTPVKVILETAALDDARKRLACRIAVDAGAAFVKTSTGFHPAGGATAADVALMRDEVGPRIGVKASGGIRTLADAMAMIGAGANRVGASATAAILASLE